MAAAVPTPRTPSRVVDLKVLRNGHERRAGQARDRVTGRDRMTTTTMRARARCRARGGIRPSLVSPAIPNGALVTKSHESQNRHDLHQSMIFRLFSHHIRRKLRLSLPSFCAKKRNIMLW